MTTAIDSQSSVSVSLSHSFWLSPAANCRLFSPSPFAFLTATRLALWLTWFALDLLRRVLSEQPPQTRRDATRWAELSCRDAQATPLRRRTRSASVGVNRLMKPKRFALAPPPQHNRRQWAINSGPQWAFIALIYQLNKLSDYGFMKSANMRFFMSVDILLLF